MRVCVCVCQRANCEWGKRRKEIREVWGTQRELRKWVKREPRDERWLTKGPDSSAWITMVNFHVIYPGLKVRGRRNNVHNGFSANCIREFSKFLYRSTVCKMIIAPATIGKDIINKRSFKEKLFVIHKFNEPIINEIPDIRNEENCKIHLNKLIMEDSTTIHPVPGYIIN